jgi:ABC-type sugar transport system ATPase subunit
MELYEHPGNLFVAGFIGSPAMNMVPCVIETGGETPSVRPAGHAAVRVVAVIPAGAVGRKGTFGVRPEDLSLTTGDDAIFRGKAELVEHLGELTLLYVDVGSPGQPVIAKLDGNVPIKRGEAIALTAPTVSLHVFDEMGKAFPRPA